MRGPLLLALSILGSALPLTLPAQRLSPPARPAFASDITPPLGGRACQAAHLAKPVRHSATLSPGHERLMARYDISFSQLDVFVERTSTNLGAGSNVETWARNLSAARTLDTIGFELHPSLTLDSLSVNGVQVPTARIRRLPAGDVQVRPLTAIAPGAAFRYRVWYHGTPTASGSAAIGDGITTMASGRWGNDVTWTLSEPFSAYEWWPCKQMLPDKLDSVAVWVTTAASNKVGANGLLQRVTLRPGGKVRYEWKSRYPLAYYLVSLSVAEYVDYTIYAHPANLPAPGDSIPVVNYVYNNPQTLAFWQADIDQTVPLIENYSAKFGLYPFWREKYGHSMAPLGGGMEHQTMTTLGSFDFTLTAHELFHQWFGDHVTCRSWADIWVNESFASYGEYLSLEALQGTAAAHDWLVNDAHAIAFQATSGSIVLPAADTTDVNRIFDYTLTYRKGASVIHMLRHVVNNDTTFYRLLADYQRRYGFGVASTEQMRQSFEASLGQPLSWFFNQWIYGEGFPVLGVRWNQVGQQIIVESQQSTTGSTPFFRMPIEFRVTRSGGTPITVRLEQTQATQVWSFTLPAGTAQQLRVDPDNWNLLQVQNIRRDATLQPLALPATVAAAPVVYPNPCTDWLLLPASASARTADILDLAGRVVAHQALAGGVDRLTTASLARGTYLLRLSDTPRAVRFSKE